MTTGDLVELLYQLNTVHSLTVESGWNASLKFYLDKFRAVRSFNRITRHLVSVFGRFVPRIFKHSAFNRASPEIVISAVG